MLRLLHKEDRLILRPCKCPGCDCNTAEGLPANERAALTRLDSLGYLDIAEDFVTETDAWWIDDDYVSDVAEYFSSTGYYAKLRDAEERHRNELAMTPFLPGMAP